MCFGIDLYTSIHIAVDTFLYCKAVVKTLYRAYDQTFGTSYITTIASAFILIVLYWRYFGIFSKFGLNVFDINRRNMIYFSCGIVGIYYVVLLITAPNYVFHEEVIIYGTIYVDRVVIARRVQAAIYFNNTLVG